MPEKNNAGEVIEFKGNESNETVTVTTDNTPVETTGIKTKSHAVEPVEPKSFTWQGVKFPAYFKGPHFIQIKGSIVLAIDPDCVSMEMRTNWQNIYVPELAALGKKIIEKHLKIKIEKLD